MTNPLNIILTNIGSTLVVYIFHKGITLLVLCGYEVQMNMYFFYFERKTIYIWY